MVQKNGLLERLQAGETTLCMPIRISRSPHVCYMARAAGFDSVYFDLEQSDASFERVGNLCQAAWAAGTTPLVRAPALDEHHLRRALDAGAGGVIVPHVETDRMAQEAVGIVRFPPRGRRGGAGAGLALGYGRSERRAAEGRLDRETLLIVMIESEEAVGRADAIAAVDGVDLLFVGTGDLARNLGVYADASDRKISEAYARVATACRNHGKWLGVGGIKGIEAAGVLGDLHRLGARFFSTRTDEALLAAAVREEASNLRNVFSS